MSFEQTPLTQLVHQFIKINKRSVTTPVLVTPRFLSLRPQFFAALSSEIHRYRKQPIRFDWCCETTDVRQLADHWLARRRSNQINRVLVRELSGNGINASIQVTATIGRPSVSADSFLIGTCSDGVELPPWTTAVRLTTTVATTDPKTADRSRHPHAPRLVGAA